MGGWGRTSVHDTTYDPLVEQNRCQVGPTILFECPAQIPRRIGVLGFSAGGHLVANISTHFAQRAYAPVDAADKVSCRPDFAVAIYLVREVELVCVLQIPV